MSFPNEFELTCRNILQGDADDLFASLLKSPEISVRLNPNKTHQLKTADEVLWCEQAYYLNERPQFVIDPFFHSGGYYPQEASSIFLNHVLRHLELPQEPIILDLCAAPGGKSTLIASFLKEKGILIANEVIRQRAEILKENCIKWGSGNIIVTNNDPADFKPIKGFFDVILVDAPCSGEGMFRKDKNAIQEWSAQNVQLCCGRQKRIISDVIDSLKPGGYLIYSTCTFNKQENEENIEWIQRELGFNLINVPLNDDWGVVTSDFGYRFYPHKTRGEGFFLSILQAPGEQITNRIKKSKKNLFKKAGDQIIENTQNWLNLNDNQLIIEYNNNIHLVSETMANHLNYLLPLLNIKNFGTAIGEILNNEIKPDHHLAMSNLLNPVAFNIIELSHEQALDYLRREEIKINDVQKGWVLAMYNNQPLGWLKNLGNRCNNYYPKEWRIRYY